MQYVPPELREDLGEVEAAQRGKLPEDLIATEDIRGMVHCHTTYSDGKHSVEQMVAAAEALGMKYITITDHSPTAFYAGGVKIDRLQRQWEEIDEVQEKTKIKILKGTESDIVADGSLDYPDWILEQFDAPGRQRFVIVFIDQQGRLAVGGDVRNAAYLGRDDRQARRETLEQRHRHVVYVRTREIDVGRVVQFRHSLMRDPADEARVFKLQLPRHLFKRRLAAAVVRDGQRGIGIRFLNDGEGAQDAFHVV